MHVLSECEPLENTLELFEKEKKYILRMQAEK